ncbi:hypothetical protein Tco_0764787 [Tanacetum coccineum]
MIRTLLVSTKPLPSTVQPVQSGKQDVISDPICSTYTHYYMESYPRLLAYAQTTPKLQRIKYVGLDPGLESVSIRRIQCVGYGVLGFLRVGTTFDIFQNIHLLYLQYGVLVFSGYGVLIMWSSWSLVSAGTDTPYLP